MSALDELKKRITAFEKAQRKWAKAGAADTEPDGLWQVRLVRALEGKDPNVPTTAEGWELYTTNPEAEKAAAELAAACKDACDFIKSVPLGESGPVREYLEAYCWRVG